MKLLKSIGVARRAFQRWKKHVWKGANTLGVPFWQRMWANLQGFTADQVVLYDLKNHRDEYITEYERWLGENVNGVYAPFMSQKLLLGQLFDDIRTPKIFFHIDASMPFNPNTGGVLCEEEILAILKREGTVIAKPTLSVGHGFGLYYIRFKDDTFIINQETVSPEALLTRIAKSEGYLFEEFVVPHPYGTAIYPNAVNTIRVISVWRKQESSPKVIMASQRIGTSVSGYVDNLGGGGICCLVDLETGKLGRGRDYTGKWYDVHPDTGAEFIGLEIPHWKQICEGLLRSHEKRRHFKFIAWDVIVTEEDFAICEVNRGCGLGLFQIHQGVRNTELGELYREYGIIK